MKTRMIVLVAIASLLALASPAAAGTPEDPEVVDVCGLTSADADMPMSPWTDICAAWVSVDGNTLTATLKLADNVISRPNPSAFAMRWTTDDGCEHVLGLSDRSFVDYLPEIPNHHIGGDEGYRVFAAICPIPPVCDKYGCYDREWEAYEYLPADAVVESGATITFTVPFTGELGVIADQYRPGRTLRGLHADTGVDCHLCLIYSDETAAGRDYQIR